MDIFKHFIKTAIYQKKYDDLLSLIKIDIVEYTDENMAKNVLNDMRKNLTDQSLTDNQKYDQFIRKYEIQELVFTLKK